MKHRYANVSLAELCGAFGKHRQTYYDRIRVYERNQMQLSLVLDIVELIRSDMPRIGTVKLYHILKPYLIAHGIKIGRDKLFSVLREKDMLIKPKKNYRITTDSYHRLKKYPNLIKDIELIRPNQLWVADITYISVRKHFAYLSLITDAYSHRIIGYCLYESLETIGCLKSLRMAIDSVHVQVESLIHHSDRGSQYCSNEYVALLQDMNISVSMTVEKDAYENAVAERINGILKAEFGLDESFYSFTKASKVVERSIAIYNEKRPHMSCNMLTPKQAHGERGRLKKHWKNYWKLNHEKGKNE